MEKNWNEWFKRARKDINTPEQLADFARELFCETEHTYDSAVHAVSALALAGAWFGCRMEGLTGFQAGFVKFDFIREWDNIGRKVGLQVIDFDHYLCYPQHVEKCPVKTIDVNVWKRAQKACADKLNALDTTTYYPDNDFVTENTACYAVRQYWGDVCSGIIPECITVVDDMYDPESKVYDRVPPICVTRPVHTIADMERDYNDPSSPWYDKERYDRERREWMMKIQNEVSGC